MVDRKPEPARRVGLPIEVPGAEQAGDRGDPGNVAGNNAKARELLPDWQLPPGARRRTSRAAARQGALSELAQHSARLKEPASRYRSLPIRARSTCASPKRKTK